MDWIWYVIVPASLVGLWGLYVGYAMVRHLLKIEFRHGDATPQPREALPAYLAEAFAEPEASLAAWGFAFHSCQSVQAPFAGPHSQLWYSVWWHPEESLYAILTSPLLPDAGTAFRSEFVTYLDDGTQLETVNGLGGQLIGELPHTVLVDALADTLEGQLAAHRQLVATHLGHRRPVLRPTAEAKADAIAHHLRAYVDQLETTGWTRPTGHGTWRLKFGPACRAAWKMLRLDKEVQAWQARRRKAAQAAPTPVEVPVEVELEAYRRNVALLERQSSGRGEKLTFFLLSMVLFAFSMPLAGFHFSPQSALILLGTLALHEFGHVAGMRLYRYRDVNVLFLPFLGAVTTGLPEREVHTYQKVVIYLLGPAPGLVLGTVLMILHTRSPHPLLLETAAMLIALNALNLLPFLPLDGGHVVKATLLARAPGLQVLFGLLSAVTILGTAFYFQMMASSGPFLLVIAAAAMLATAQDRRLLALLQAVRARLQGRLDEATVLREIFLAMREGRFARFAFHEKFHLARHVVREATVAPPSWGSIAVCLACYMLVWAIPVLGVWISLQGVIRAGWRPF